LFATQRACHQFLAIEPHEARAVQLRVRVAHGSFTALRMGEYLKQFSSRDYQIKRTKQPWIKSTTARYRAP
jgi:acyl dehydratase